MTKKIGIIGGSGLYEIAELKDKKWLPKKEGPFGMPSDDILYGQIDKVEVYFYLDMEENIHFSTNVPYRANIDVLKDWDAMILYQYLLSGH